MYPVTVTVVTYKEKTVEFLLEGNIHGSVFGSIIFIIYASHRGMNDECQLNKSPGPRICEL
jgi:hypothetical protein